MRSCETKIVRALTPVCLRQREGIPVGTDFTTILDHLNCCYGEGGTQNTNPEAIDKWPIWAISGAAKEEEKVMVTWISDIFIHI